MEGALARPLAQQQHVAMAVVHDQAGARDLALNERVGGDCRAVDDDLDRAEEAPEVLAVALGRRLQHVHEALMERARRGRRLEDPDLAARVGDQRVGEGAADVDADLMAHALLALPLAG